VTPVLAMLHDLVSDSSPREIWWLYAARNSGEHPFRHEVRALLDRLQRSHSHIWYSAPTGQDVNGRDFDTSGRLRVELFSALGIRQESGFYLCGPTSFLRDVRAELLAWGVGGDRIYSEIFGSSPSSTPGIVCESGLISGDVAYGPEPLDPPASGNVLLCCATPRGDVVLDL
jgi:ferredoxin-NADP reductase